MRIFAEPGSIIGITYLGETVGLGEVDGMGYIDFALKVPVYSEVTIRIRKYGYRAITVQYLVAKEGRKEEELNLLQQIDTVINADIPF